MGRGIMRKAAQENWPCEFVVWSRDEQKHIHAKRKYPNARYFTGDILNPSRMLLIMSMCDYVVHTAAIKYIPECEAQPEEAIRVNVDGSRMVMDVAREARIKRCVLISTDKAAAPVNTYGMTKALTERLVWETADTPSPSGTEFVACRYGNVIGSTGSVWHAFQEQNSRLGRVSVTDPDMTRFYFGIDDAVDLIVAAMTAAPAGVLVVPQPKSLRLGELAEYVTKLWRADAPTVVGARPGEKLHENMVSESEVDRMASFGSRWLMFGPTKQAASLVCRPTGMSSDSADPMSPDEFVSIALDSESV